jgi:hypothetical protein
MRGTVILLPFVAYVREQDRCGRRSAAEGRAASRVGSAFPSAGAIPAQLAVALPRIRSVADQHPSHSRTAPAFAILMPMERLRAYHAAARKWCAAGSRGRRGKRGRWRVIDRRGRHVHRCPGTSKKSVRRAVSATVPLTAANRPEQKGLQSHAGFTLRLASGRPMAFRR